MRASLVWTPPQLTDGAGTSEQGMSIFNHAALVSAAYASSDALPHPHARLASCPRAVLRLIQFLRTTSAHSEIPE